MGNQHSSSTVAIKRRLSRTSSNAEATEKYSATIIPVEKLTKILGQQSSSEDSKAGVTCRVFLRHLFRQYPDLGLRLFGYLHVCAGSTTVDCMSQSAFRTQVEKLISILDDDLIREVYIKMFAACKAELMRENFEDLMMTVYRMAMDHYPEGPQTCINIHRTIQTVTNAVYHQKPSLTVGFVTHWVQLHCPRLVQSLHKYVVHVLTTGYRNTYSTDNSSDPPTNRTSPPGLDLSTPVLEKTCSWGALSLSTMHLPLSEVWLLTTSLPPIFSRPQPSPTPPGGIPSPHHVVMKMMGSQFPSHWLPIYNSSSHGLGANRFLNHVLHYRGPTLTIITAGSSKFLIAVPEEWRESHLYWGSPDTTIMQLSPEYHVLERGPKSMFLNCSIRGYPKGIRAGADTRKPCLSVDDDFSKVLFKDIPYPLSSIEVWGCGLPEERDAQLEVKKWQVKEAEKQRVVKINAKEWIDHPDRYLLELNGRPVYNATSN